MQSIHFITLSPAQWDSTCKTLRWRHIFVSNSFLVKIMWL